MKLFLTLLLLIFCNAVNSQICHNLFNDSDLNKYIHSLAQLRLELDLAQTDNTDTLTISLLKIEYEKREKSVLKYISRDNLLKLMKLEIANLQKDSAKQDQVEAQHKRDVYKSVHDGSLAIFHPFVTQGPDSRDFSVMQSPITEAIWQKVTALIDYSEPNKNFLALDTNPAINSELHPVSNVSYLKVLNWITALKIASNRNESELKKIFPDHQKGDTYRLPSDEEWILFIESLVKQTLAREETRALWVKNVQEDVTKSKPYKIQNNDYYFLLGNATHWVESDFHPDRAESVDVEALIFDDRVDFKIHKPNYDKSAKTRSVFRLIRERP